MPKELYRWATATAPGVPLSHTLLGYSRLSESKIKATFFIRHLLSHCLF
ncbi:MAG: hypothetical protein ABIK46_04610 [candidate division WOR-3 bacterium]